MFGWSSGELMVPTSVQVVVPLIARWTTNDVSVIDSSMKLSVCVALSNTSVSALNGGSASSTGRIMSISSWDRMWQWYTYSQPKLTSAFVTVVTLPFGSTISPLGSMSAPSGIIGLSGRMLFGTSNGRVGTIGRSAMIVSS